MSMMRSPRRAAALIVAGPAVLGFCLSLRPGTTWTEGFGLPLILLVVTAVMLPALYIGAGLLDLSPRGDAVIQGAVEGLSRCSWACLGLAPALAFLVGTSTSMFSGALVAYGMAAIAVGLGLRGLFHTTFGGGWKATAFFAAWSVVSCGIGARLFLTVLQGGYSS